jgi:hypothetical protein
LIEITDKNEAAIKESRKNPFCIVSEWTNLGDKTFQAIKYFFLLVEK